MTPGWEAGPATAGAVRERVLTETFVALADTLAQDYAEDDLMQTLVLRLVHLLPVDASGVLLSNERGELRVVAASRQQTYELDVLAAQRQEGPCWDCFRSGDVVAHVDEDPRPPSRADQAGPSPLFTRLRRAQGFRSVYAVPMRWRNQIIGVLNMFRCQAGPLSVADLQLACALADVATIGLLQRRVIRDQERLAEQLQTALRTRVLIEQAKGVLAERSGLGMDEAFEAMRRHARAQNRLLTTVARDVIDNTPGITVLISGRA